MIGGSLKAGDKAKGKLPRVSSILSGAIRVFFGAGQPPNTYTSYHNPTEWAEVGSLLRIPQVIWLSSQLGGFSGGPDMLSSQSPLDGSSPTPIELPPINPALVEAERLAAVFAEVKDAIEAMRPGRTWVQVIDYNSFDGASLDANIRTGFLFTAPLPLASDSDYLGTDFLFIYGGRATVYSGGFLQTTTIFTGSPNMFTSWTTPKSRIVAATPRFQRISHKLYTDDVAWAGLISNMSGPGNPTGVDFPVGDDEAELQANTAEFMAACADDLGSREFVVAGACSSLTTSGLIDTIAAHFGFHPGTGKDL